MTTTAWHASDLDLAEYRDGTITALHASSVEAHLLACDGCRRRLAALAGAGASPAVTADDRQARVWAGIADRIDQPSRRLLRAPDGRLRTLLGTAPLLGATVGAVALVLLAPLAALVSVRAGVTALMALAPLAPLVGVVVAFRPAAEPAGELGLAAPLASMRLLTARAGAVAVASLPAGLAATFLLPVDTASLLGWVLPGIAFTAVTTAVGTRLDPTRVAIGLATGWAVLVGALAADLRTEPVRDALADWAVNRAASQLVLAAVAAVALVVTLQREGALVSLEDR